MAVYLTKSMLSRMNQVKYPSCNKLETISSVPDHWQKLFKEGNKTIELSRAMICRVCGQDGYTPITEKINDFTIMLAMRSVANISVDTNDSLPKYVCTHCLEKLKGAIEFKKMCESSERKFKKILNPMGDPSMHSYPYSKHDFQLILHEMKEKKIRIEEEKARERHLRESTLQKKFSRGKEFKCSSCDTTFETKDQLSTHRRERLCMWRACDICGQLVVSIRQHMRLIHKQKATHMCPSCGKEFPIFARLKNHMLVHTNTFNFFCDICPYKCKHKYYLVMHMRTHTGEKPYKCQQCPATFVNPSNLNKHKLTHQEKQFKCMLCEKAFRTNAGLREHHEAAHMNIKHTCNYCGRDFCYRSDLRKHEIRNHNRTKRDYIGGEPTYKQVERMQKMENEGLNKWRPQENMQKIESEEMIKWRPQENMQKIDTEEMIKWRSQESMQKIESEEINKWRSQEIVVTQPTQIIQATYIDASKDYGQSNQTIFFSDVTGLMTQQPIQQVSLVPAQTVEITLPELTLKKDDGKITYVNEGHQSIGYF